MESAKSTENLTTRSGDDGNNKIQLVMLVIAVVVAIVALIVAFIALSQNGTTNVMLSSPGGTPSSDSSFEDKIWLLAAGHSNTRDQYIDEVTGELKGFNIDLVNAVCKLANKNCRVIYDIWIRCWDSEAGQVARGGVGLMDGWYDACVGWYGTYDRYRTFTFSTPYNRGESESLFVKKGSPLASMWKDMTGKKIGILDGWWTDEFCLLRNKDQFDAGLPLTETQINHYFDTPELLEAINNGTVSYAFIGVKTDIAPMLDRVDGNPVLPCARQSMGIMLRKDKTELLDWFNQALSQLMDSPGYRDVCRDVEEIHGHKTGSTAEEVCFLD